MEFIRRFGKPPKVHINNQKPSEHVESLLKEGQNAVASRNYEKAVRMFSRIIPPTLDSLFFRGCARLKFCDVSATRAAIEDFDKAIKLNRSHNIDQNNEKVTKLLYKRGFAYQSIGQHKHAIENFDEIIKLIENTTSSLVHKTLLNRALAYEAMNEPDKALNDIERANKLNPNDAYYLYCQARIYALLGRKTDAETDLTQAKVLEQENSSQSLFHEGFILYRMNEFVKAQNLFTTILSKSTTTEHRFESADVYFYRAITFYELGEKEKARRDLEKVIECNPKHARAYFRLGMIQAHSFNLLHEALKNYTHAHQLAPHQADILYERGELNFKLGRLNAGIDDKRLALQLKDLYSESDEIRYKKMLNRAKNNLSEQPNSASAHLNIAVYKDKLLDYANDQNRNAQYLETVAEYEEAIKADEGENRYPYAGALLICCHQKEGKLLDAFSLREILDEAFEKKNSTMRLAWDKMTKFFENASQDFGNKLVLTEEQIRTIIMINKNQKMIKEDEDYFMEADKVNNNNNLITFYKIMRRSLAHMFAAIGVVSGGGETQIVKHDVKGTKAWIGEGVRLLTQVVGSLLPQGGTAVSTVGGIAAGRLEDRDYNENQNKFRMISLLGDPEELRGVSIKVTRIITDRYIKQIGSLKSENKFVPSVSCCCCKCRSGKWKEAVPFVDELDVKEPVARVAIFGANYSTEALRDTSETELGLSYNMKEEELVNIFVRLICNADRNLKKKIVKKAHLDLNEILPHTYRGSDEEWNLYEFYRKPGIRVDQEAEDHYKDRLASYMEPDKYGYRLGTTDELDKLQQQKDV